MALPSNKLFYKIGEVCDLCDIQPHVLRYWETEFSMLSPSKNSSGQRIYRHRDVELIQAIKRLLYQEGYTIAGANKKLTVDLRAGEHLDELFVPSDAAVVVVQPPPPKRRPLAELSTSDLLHELRRQIEEVLDLLRSSDK